MLDIELVYSREDKSLVHLSLKLPEGSTVSQALEQSGIFASHPETRHLSMGIFSKIVTLHTPLQQGDRIEIYRALRLNPMEKRRQKAKKKRG